MAALIGLQINHFLFPYFLELMGGIRPEHINDVEFTDLPKEWTINVRGSRNSYGGGGGRIN